MKVINKYLLCPDCGHVVFGYRCKRCNRIVNNKNPVSKVENRTQALEDAKRQKQKIVEIISEVKPGTPGMVTMIEPIAERQTDWQETDSDEQTGVEPAVEEGNEAEFQSALIIADVQHKAHQIMCEVEKTAMEVADTTMAEADTKAKTIIDESRQKADQILNEGKKAVEELTNKANLEAKAKSNGIIAEARKKAAQIIEDANIISEAKKIAAESMQQNTTEETSGKITGKDIIIASIIILAGIILIIAAYFYARYNM